MEVENKFTIILKSFLYIYVFIWYVVCLWSIDDQLSMSSDYRPGGDFWMYVLCRRIICSRETLLQGRQSVHYTPNYCHGMLMSGFALT